MSRQLLTVKDVADRLEMCEAKVWRMVGDGTLPSIKVGKNRRVPEHVLDAYIDGLVAEQIGHAIGSAA